MRKKLIYTNSSGDSIVISDRPFVLQKISGFNNIKNNIYTSKSMGQDGETYTDSNLGVRELIINGVLYVDSRNLKQVYRREMIKVLNPKLDGRLQYECDDFSKTIDCKVENAPVFGDESLRMQPFDITLLCPKPFFKDLDEIKADIVLWVGDFEFPLEIPQDTGIEMGHREPSLIVNVLNNGDVECGMRIVFKALATLTNPSLFNVNTREYIKINKGMVAGETITITTHFGNKKIIDNLNGVASNAFMYIDLGSTFLQLAVGDNLFRYNADTGIDNLECEIYFTPQYLGV